MALRGDCTRVAEKLDLVVVEASRVFAAAHSARLVITREKPYASRDIPTANLRRRGPGGKA